MSFEISLKKRNVDCRSCNKTIQSWEFYASSKLLVNLQNKFCGNVIYSFVAFASLTVLSKLPCIEKLYCRNFTISTRARRNIQNKNEDCFISHYITATNEVKSLLWIKKPGNTWKREWAELHGTKRTGKSYAIYKSQNKRLFCLEQSWNYICRLEKITCSSISFTCSY